MEKNTDLKLTFQTKNVTEVIHFFWYLNPERLHQLHRMKHRYLFNTIMSEREFVPEHSLKIKAEMKPITLQLMQEMCLYANTTTLCSRFETVGICNCMHTFEYA